MPFNQLHRRDSWPPTILRLHHGPQDNDSPPSDIDPITFFLTPSTSLDDLTEEDYPFEIDDLSAGIEDSSYSAKKPEVREISPSKLQRAKLTDELDIDVDSSNDDIEDIYFDFTMPLLSLKDFSLKHTTKSGRKSRLENHQSEESRTGVNLTLLSSSPPPSRGRAKFRLTHTRGRGQTRSLPVRRPHSWREPSPDLGRIEEVDEDVEGGVRFGMRIENGLADERLLSSSAPPPAVSAMRIPGSPRKEKKVHWAL